MRRPFNVYFRPQTSEEDLPICGANEICSKIDLYRTPWIERQCRCPTDKHYRILKGAVHDLDHIEKNHELRTRNRQALLYNLRLEKLSDSVYSIESDYMMKLAFLQDIDNDLMRHTDDNSDGALNIHSLHVHKLAKSRRRPLDNEVRALKIRHHNNGGSGSGNGRTGRCSSSLNTDDGYTIADKTRLYKTCEPVQRLPVCRYVSFYFIALHLSSR